MRYPDEGTLRDSRKSGKTLDRAGVDNNYLDKKRTRASWSADSDGVHGSILNRLPPGTHIEDQRLSEAETTADRLKKAKVVDAETGRYPGDGWED